MILRFLQRKEEKVNPVGDRINFLAFCQIKNIRFWMKKEAENRSVRGEKVRKTGIGGKINGNSSRFSPDLSEKPAFFDKKPARF